MDWLFKQKKVLFWKLDRLLGNLDCNCQLIVSYTAVSPLVYQKKKKKNFGFWFQFQT
jgi:hypothetical protein